VTADAREAWGFVKTMLLHAAEKMPEENYPFKPVPKSAPFAERLCATVKG